MAMLDETLNPREKAFMAGVKDAYARRGTPLMDVTAAQVAKGLSAAIPCRTDDVAEVFRILAGKGQLPTHSTMAAATAELERGRNAGVAKVQPHAPGDILLSDYLKRRGLTFAQWLAAGSRELEAFT